MKLQNAVEKAMIGVTADIKASGMVDSNLEKLNKLRSCLNKVVTLPISDIVMKDNVRHHVDEDGDDFKKLCESIQTFGLMKNIVAELHALPNDQFEIVCVSGHRRLTALRKLNWQEKIPVLLKQFEKGQRIGAALSENINRKDLPFVDVAHGYFSLQSNGWSTEDLVRHFEKDKKTIARYLKLGEMPDDIKGTIRKNSEVLTARVVFNELLPKTSGAGELRKAIERKLSKMPKPKTDQSERQRKIKTKLDLFFEEKRIADERKQVVLEAFRYVGVI